jgi:hypothetical protein
MTTLRRPPYPPPHPARRYKDKLCPRLALPARGPPRDETFISSVDRRAQGYLCYRLSGMTGMTPMATHRSLTGGLLLPVQGAEAPFSTRPHPHLASSSASTDSQHRPTASPSLSPVPCCLPSAPAPLLQLRLQFQLPACARQAPVLSPPSPHLTLTLTSLPTWPWPAQCTVFNSAITAS